MEQGLRTSALESNAHITRTRSNRIANGLLVLAILLVLAFAIGLNTVELGAPPTVGTDEGVYLLVARLLHLGYSSNSIVWDQPPLFVILISWAFKIGGDSLLTGRLLIAAFSIAALLALAGLPRAWNARFAVPIVLLLAATNSFFLRYSRVVMGEIPCLAFLLASFAVLAQYKETNRRGWLIASGALLSLALAIKPIAIGFGISFVILLLADTWHSTSRASFSIRRRIWDLVWFEVSAGLILIPALELYNLDAFLRNVIGFHLAENALHTGAARAMIGGLIVVLERNAPLVALALPGMFAAVRRNRIWTAAIVAGMFATVGVLFLLPSFLHHYTLLVPFFALFGGIGILDGIVLFLSFINKSKCAASWNTRSPSRVWNTLYLAVLVLCLIFASSQIIPLARQDRSLIIQRSKVIQTRVDFITKRVPAGAFVLSDDPMLAYLANTKMPPCGILFAYPLDWNNTNENTQRLGDCLNAYPVQFIIQTGGYVRVPALSKLLRTRFPKLIQGPKMQLYGRG